MTELIEQSNTVFIDVASSSTQFPLYEVASEALPADKTDKNRDEDAIKKEDGGCKTECISPLHPSLELIPRRFRCTECPKYTAENEEKLLRHIRKVHRGENPFQCYMCDYSTYNKCLFEEHVRIHQGIKPFKCSHCPYRSASKKNTKKHELIHRPDNPHKCQHCDFIARHRRSLRCHLNSEHGNGIANPNLTECSHCKKKVEDHRAHIEGRIQCSLCEKIFCYKKLLKKHMLEVHGEKSKFSNAEFVCAICKWSSNVRPRILLHLIHHPNQPVDSNVVDVQILKICGIEGPDW